MPFLEDFQAYLEEEEKRKTKLTGRVGTGRLPAAPEAPSFGLSQSTLDAFRDPRREDPVPAEDMNIGEVLLYDVLGRGLWSFADEAAFGTLGLGAKAYGVDENMLYSKTLAGKMSQGIGTLAGFVVGGPMKLGLKASQFVARPFLKKAVKEMGQEAADKFIIGSTKKITSDISKKAAEQNFTKEVIDGSLGTYKRLGHMAKLNKELAENYLKHTDDAVDNLSDFYIKTGKIKAKEAEQFKTFFKDNFRKRPLQDFADLWAIRGGNPLVGNIAHEAVMFGAIDAFRMPIHAALEAEDGEMVESFFDPTKYHYTDILWGAGIGAGFGTMKWMMPAPKGRGAKWNVDFVDGVKAALSRNVYAKKGTETLQMHSKLLGDQLDDIGENVIREGTYKGTAYSFNLRSPEKLTALVGEEAAQRILSKELHSLVKEQGRELITYALSEEGKSMGQNWMKMVLGSTIMNARTIYDINVNDVDMKFEDVLPSVLIGAWVNRRGVPRTWDMSTRVDRIRGNLKLLGADARQLRHLPTFDPYITSHLNPVNSHEGLRAIQKKAESLGIISDSYDVIAEKRIGTEQSVLAADAVGEPMEVFHGIHRLLSGTGRFVRPKDDISIKQAKELERMAKDIKFEELYDTPTEKIVTGRDFEKVVERVSEGATEKLEGMFVNSAHEIASALGIELNTSETVMGKLPDKIDPSLEVKAMAKRGELKWLTDAEGTVLSGHKALEALDSIARKTEKLFGLVQDSMGRATLDANVKYVNNVDTLKKLHDTVLGVEAEINKAADLKEGFKFDMLTGADDLSVPIIMSQAKKASKGVSELFDVNNPNSDARESLQRALFQTGLLRGGQGEAFTLITDVSKIKIRNAPDEAAESHAKTILTNALSVLGAKGQYLVGSKAASVKEVDYSLIMGSGKNSLQGVLELNGMRTSQELMQTYNSFVTNYILRDKIAKSNLNMDQVNFLNGLMTAPREIPVIQFNPAGNGKVSGWVVYPIKLTPGVTGDSYTYLLKEYNTHVKKIAEASDGLVKLGEPVSIVNEKVIDHLIVGMHSNLERGKSRARDVMTDFVNALDMQHGALKMMIHQFNNSGNQDNASRLLLWLQRHKLISRETSDGVTKYSLNVDKTKQLDAKTIGQLKDKITAFGINRTEAETLYKIAKDEVDDMLYHQYGARSKEATLTRDQFFKKYFPETEKQTSNQDATLQSLLYDSNGNPVSNPVERLLEHMTVNINGAELPAIEIKGSAPIVARGQTSLTKGDRDLIRGIYSEARDDAVHMVLSQLRRTDQTFIRYDDGVLSAETKSVSETPFMRAVRAMGFEMMPIIGSNQIFSSHNGGKMRSGRYAIFTAETDFLPGEQRDRIRNIERTFEKDLFSMTELPVKSRDDLADPIRGQGLVLMKLTSSIQPFAMQRSDLHIITSQFEQFVKRAEKMGIERHRIQEMKKDLEKLQNLDDPSIKTSAHEAALRVMMIEKLTSTSKDHSVFRDVVNGKENLEKLVSRFALFHTPQYRYAEADFAKKNNLASTKYEKTLADYFASKKKVGVVMWNDKDFADIYKNLSKENQKFWDNNLHGRDSDSAFDSITFISRGFRDYLALSHGQYAGSDGRVFKPVISANKEVLLFGKTAFVYDPAMDSFFKNNMDVDIVTTRSASKIYSKEQWKTLDTDADGVLKARNLTGNGYTQFIPISSIGIKSDKVKDIDRARISQQIYNYMTSSEASRVFNNEYYNKIDNALYDVRKFVTDSNYLRNFFTQGTYDESFIETMVEGAAGSSKLGSLRAWADYGNPMEIGENIVMSQLYRKVLEPLISPQAELNGTRYGGKAVLMQSLDPAKRDLKFTKVDSNGKLIEYGEIILPHADGEAKIKPLLAGKKDLKLKLIDRKTNELVDPETILTKEVYESFDTLRELHEFLGSHFERTKRYQIAIVNTRYPRTRPNDLGVLGLRGFNSKASGNIAQVNALDVLNIFEGDYDIDKSDYFWMQSQTVFDHIKASNQRFVQGIDPGKFNTPSLGLDFYGSSSRSSENLAWHKEIGNSSVLGGGIGLVQKVPRLANFMYDIAEKRVDNKGIERAILMDDGRFEVRVDYNNKDWFHRQVLEAQTIIDAGSNIDRDIMHDVFEWRHNFMFPSKSESVSAAEAAKNPMGFLSRVQSGRKDVPSKVRFFTKYDKLTGEEVELTTIEKASIKEIIKQYSDFLQLGTDIYDNTGRGKSATYDDVMNLSDRYFAFMGNISDGVYWNIGNKRSGSSAGKFKNHTEYVQKWGKQQKEKYRSIKKREKDPTALPEYYYVPEGDVGPFTQAVVENARGIAKGTRGNVFDRIMHQVWSNDPLGARMWKVFSSAEWSGIDDAMRRFYGNEYKNADEFAANWMSYATSLRKGQSSLRYLKRQFGNVAKLKMSPEQKRKKVEELNEAMSKIEDQILDMLPKKYQKSRKSKDIGYDIMKFLPLTDKEVQDGAVQYYTMQAISRISGTSNRKHMSEDISRLKEFERNVFADQAGLEYTLEYGDLSFLTQAQRDWLGNFPNRQKVNEIINTKLEEGVAKHGFSFLYEYGSPIAHKNAIGLYAGKPHPVTYGATNRFGRVFQFMASKSIQNKEYRDAIRLIAPIADHYRNYFTGRHDLMSRDSDALPDGLNYDMLKFPKFQQTLQSGFDNFASLRWKKATGAEDPFQIMNDDLLNFYGEIFTLAGKSEQFELYRKQLSHVNASLMNNDIINPFNYLHMLNNLEAEVHKFVGENFSAGIDPKGKLTTSDKMKSNPMWILLGGDKHVKGFSMHPKYRASAKKLRMQREMSQQANLINKTKPGEGKMKEFEEIIKICRGNK